MLSGGFIQKFQQCSVLEKRSSFLGMFTFYDDFGLVMMILNHRVNEESPNTLLCNGIHTMG